MTLRVERFDSMVQGPLRDSSADVGPKAVALLRSCLQTISHDFRPSCSVFRWLADIGAPKMGWRATEVTQQPGKSKCECDNFNGHI